MFSTFSKCSLVVAVFTISLSQVSAQCPNSQSYIQPACNQPVYSQPVYSQPIYSQPYTVVSPQPVSPAELARMYTTEAKTLFASGQYQLAKQKLDEVVQRVPKDADAFQFRALAAFAAADFDNAAADAYDSMGLGNAWTLPVIQSLYGNDLNRYRTHLGTLKRVVAEKPTMQSHFLLAYHHVMNEEWAEGKVQLQQVLKLQAEEPLSTKLLAVVETKLTALPAEVR
ncbi:hypothetical protein OAG68_00475 [bacterium]|nr:hypothetical protein [bacterium]